MCYNVCVYIILHLFLLYSTIHYDDCGGFQELLDGVWEVLPDGTPLVGGTFGGFINQEGCYIKGVTAMAVSYPNMNVITGYGKNTKRSPKKAANHCVKMIKNGLKNKHENKFMLSIISGMRLPKSGSSIIRSKILAYLSFIS